MRSLKITLGLSLLGFSLVGCEKPVPPETQLYPMVYWEEKDMVKQLFTYGGEQVIKEDIVLEGRQVNRVLNTIYINHKSQIVYKDGTPIVGPYGYYVFWDKKGRFINTNYQLIPESRLFILHGKPMPDRTAIMIKAYFDEAKSDYNIRKGSF